MGSDVITIRIPKEMRERMKRVNINWSSVIRDYIKEVLEKEERRQLWMQAMHELSRIPPAEEGFSVRSVREDRDNR